MKITKEDLKEAIKSRFINGLDKEQQSAILATYVMDLLQAKLGSVILWAVNQSKEAERRFESAEADRLEDGDVGCNGVNYMEEMSYNEGIIDVLTELYQQLSL